MKFEDTNKMDTNDVRTWLQANGFPRPVQIQTRGNTVIGIDFGSTTLTAAQKTGLAAKFPNLTEF